MAEASDRDPDPDLGALLQHLPPAARAPASDDCGVGEDGPGGDCAAGDAEHSLLQVQQYIKMERAAASSASAAASAELAASTKSSTPPPARALQTFCGLGC